VAQAESLSVDFSPWPLPWNCPSLFAVQQLFSRFSALG